MDMVLTPLILMHLVQRVSLVNNSGAGRILVSAHTLAFMLELKREKDFSSGNTSGSGFGQRAVSKKFHLQDRSIGVIGC